jgi:hypothetical protein
LEHVESLKCIICGFEHGGTTMLSELIRQHPAVDGRFEIGFLLEDRIADFYREDNLHVEFVRSFWGVSDACLRDYICKASNWNEAYRRLVECSVVDDDTLIYDKTPGYMSMLNNVLAKVDAPCVALVRDPRAILCSTRKRHNLTTEAFYKHYRWYARGLNRALKRFPQRILVVQYEHLCFEPRGEAKRIYDFLGLDLDDSYIALPERVPKHNNVHGAISDSFVYEYKDKLSKPEQDLLLRKLARYRQWQFR